MKIYFILTPFSYCTLYTLHFVLLLLLLQAYENAQDPQAPRLSHRDQYFEGVMSKVLMALDAMCRYSDTADWVFFMDGDVHINAGTSTSRKG